MQDILFIIYIIFVFFNIVEYDVKFDELEVRCDNIIKYLLVVFFVEFEVLY